MNVDNLISRATHTTGRSLLAVASAIILSSWYDYPLNKFPVIAIATDIPINMVVTAAMGILVFLIITHFLNWMNDKLTYKTSALKEFHETSQNPINLVNLLDAIKKENTAIEGLGPENTQHLQKLLDGYYRTLKITSWTQWMMVYLQHCIVPIIAGILAVVLLFKSI